MKRSRSIVGIAVVVSSVVLIGAGIAAHRAIEQLDATSAAVLRSKDIELDFERLLSNVRDAETGQRGYLLTNDEAYLEPYHRALRELQMRLQTIRDHIRADGGEPDDLESLKDLVRRRIAVIAHTLELNRAGNHAAALDVAGSNEGKRLMDRIRVFVG